MAAADYFDIVQKLYIAYYQRPADPAGLKYWADKINTNGGDASAVVGAFAASPEAISLYSTVDSTTIGNVIDKIYLALFNRAPDTAGKQFFIDGFTTGTLNAGSIALAVLNGARNDDNTSIQNKVQVANLFTAQVDGRALTDAAFGTGTSFNATYSGNTDAQAARVILKAVTFDSATVLTPAQVTQQVITNIANSGDSIIPTPPPEPTPAFTISINAGGDAYVKATEATTTAALTPAVTSSTLSSIKVSGLKVTDNSVLSVTTTKNVGTGNYEFDATQFKDGTLTVVATDVYGQTRSTTLTLDTVAPADATIAVTGELNGLNTTEATPTVATSITPETGATLVSAKIGTTALTVVDAQAGTYSFNATGLAEGEHTITVVTADAAGNQKTTTKFISKDTVAPTQTLSTIALSVDTGESLTDFITKTASQTITATLSGALGSGEELHGSLDNGDSWTNITAKVSGTAVSWDDATLLSPGLIQLQVRDAAGNAGTAATQNYSLDTSAPTRSLSGIALSADTGGSSTDFITKTAGQTITATLNQPLARGEELYGSVDNGAHWTKITDKVVSGTTVNWTGATLLGSSSIKLEVRDAAGNAGTAATQAYMLDTAAPIAGTLALNEDTNITTDGITTNGAVTVSNLEQDATWQYTVNGANQEPTWTAGIGDSFTLAEGTYAIGDVKVRQTDAAGNVQTTSMASNADLITVDTTAPTASLFTATAASVGATSNEAGMLRLYDVLGTVIGRVVPFTTPNGLTRSTDLPFQNTFVSPLTLKVSDTAGNFAATTRNVTLGNDQGELLDVRSGVNIIFGFGGNDEITGYIGDDIIDGGAGADSINGGAGNDTASYAGSSTVSINLGTRTYSGGHAEGDTLSSIENLIGSGFDDTLTGDANANVLTGGAGNDRFVFNAVFGTSSDSSINTGVDAITDLAAGDVIVANLSNVGSFDGSSVTGDSLFNNFIYTGGVTSGHLLMIKQTEGFGDGGDTALGSIRIDVGSYSAADAASQVEYHITGTSGGDTIVAGGKNDVINGGDGDDTITGGAGADIISGGLGADTFKMAAGDNVVNFLNGNSVSISGLDTVTDMTAANDRIDLGAFNLSHIAQESLSQDGITDGHFILLYGTVANDQLTFAARNSETTHTFLVYDSSTGTNPAITTEAVLITGVITAADLMAAPIAGVGEPGTLAGGNFIDTMSGTSAAETFVGGAGNDVIDVGIDSSSDTVEVGTVAAAGIDVVTNFSTNDRISFAGWGGDGRSFSYDARDFESTEFTAGHNLVDLNSVLAFLGAETSSINKAIGFSYGGKQYVLINNSDDAYSAAGDAVIQLVGNVVLSDANFGLLV